uniref:Uncharacterized protein n=1 Tax=Petromyzon marinus TaxID=7757 RepID=S4RGQ7_PETMA
IWNVRSSVVPSLVQLLHGRAVRRESLCTRWTHMGGEGQWGTGTSSETW